MKVKRALISVSDKEGVVAFAQALSEAGVEIISTGGTAGALAEAGVPVRQIDDLTGFPEMMDGRLKTLHPKVHGGILGDRSKASHRQAMEEHGIEPIDLVVVNLYPFRETVARPGVTLEEAIEKIDIGGPAMIRSASKNFHHVGVVVDPKDYAVVAEQIRDEGGLDADLRLRLATKAFAHTASYDAAINRYFEDRGEGLPETVVLDFHRAQTLRYGENPHQQAAFYRELERRPGTVAWSHRLSGLELSFNNLVDLDAALQLVMEFDEPAAAVLKHTNPCGCAAGGTLEASFRAAREADRMSAFGGIIAVNRELDPDTARAITEPNNFFEAIIAPGFTAPALEMIQARKGWGANVRLLDCGALPARADRQAKGDWDLKRLMGGLLIQERDLKDAGRAEMRVVTQRQPSEEEWEALLFSWKVVKHVKSNAIAIARVTEEGGQRVARLLGMGAGQPNRVWPVQLAVQNAGELAKGAVLASDAFFPKPDGPQTAAEAGLTAIIQPGGSKGDAEVIEVANRHNLAMVFTGIRHFKH
ncbi:MAG TPA: bifunctional phosphoribosylaminoimidazolecarboxamide formyltransferase/IMP cyclohydrolase [Armatimonadota bacterium]